MMQPPPSWNELQAFLAIARSGQMARAAAAAGVDATTLGRRLRRLEARLGQALFEQSRRGQQLTEAGERLLALVEPMQQAADRIFETRDDGEGLTGLLRVSLSEGFGSWFVARHLHAFTAAHPRLQVDLVANNGFLNPSRREADVAVMLARPRTGPVVAAKLVDYRLGLYAARDYLARTGTPASIDALAGEHRLIGYVPDLLYAPELRYLSDIDARLAPDIRSSSIVAQYRLVAAGAGIGILPRFIGGGDATLVPVLPDVTVARSFWMVTHRDTRRLTRIREFRRWLIALVARHRDAFG